MQIPNEIIKTGIAIDEKYFDLRGLAEYSSFGLSSIRHHIKNNSLPHYAVRNDKGAITKILIRKSEFDAWMQKKWKDDLDDVVDGILREFQNEPKLEVTTYE